MGDAETPASTGRSNSGLLYFFERDNAEVFVKVLDGCMTQLATAGSTWRR